MQQSLLNGNCTVALQIVDHFKKCTNPACLSCEVVRKLQVNLFGRNDLNLKRPRDPMISHACRCHDNVCRMPWCIKMRRVIGHIKVCRHHIERSSQNSTVCNEIYTFCIRHASMCQDIDCKLSQL